MPYFVIQPTSGLFLEDTASNGTEALTVGAPLLFDDNIIVAASPTDALWHYHYAYGLDLGSSKEISRIICYDHIQNDNWYTSGNDSVKVFKSDDNVSYTFVEQFDAPTRTFGVWFLTLAVPQFARYWKVFNCEVSSTLADPIGSSLKITELRIYYSTPDFILSGTVKLIGVGIARTVRSYTRSTGVLYASTDSDPDGTFSVPAPDDATEMFVIAFDDDAGADYNALIYDRVKGVAV